MAVLTTSRLALPYPDGNDRLRDGDNRIGDLASALDDLEQVGIPWAMACGSASVSASGSDPTPTVAVTFPSGRFTHTPIVVASVPSFLVLIPYLGTISTAGMTVGMTHVTPGTNITAGTYIIWWHAIQMLSGASPG